MTGVSQVLSSLKPNKGGTVTFGDNAKRHIVGIGNVGNSTTPNIEKVLLVDGLKHSLLSVSQLTDKNFLVVFDKHTCHIISKYDMKIV